MSLILSDLSFKRVSSAVAVAELVPIFAGLGGELLYLWSFMNVRELMKWFLSCRLGFRQGLLVCIMRFGGLIGCSEGDVDGDCARC